MTSDERKALAEQWTGLAAMYGKEITKPALKIMIDAVNDLDFQSVLQAMNKWATLPGKNTHPLPGDIRTILNPPLDHKVVAVALARKIDDCVRKHGWAWDQGVFGENGPIFYGAGTAHSTFKEAVIAEVGPVGWAVIRQKGGWKATCDSSNSMDEGIFIAQTRDLVQATLQLESQGIDLAQLEMPKKEGLQAPGNVQNLLGSMKRWE